MKISEKFEELRNKDEAALITYVCAGDPDPGTTEEIVNTLVRYGADIVELGLPFSDPTADGPTIQAAAERALSAGMNTDRYFELVASVEVPIPLICMTYYNLIFKWGIDRFVTDCTRSGITGIIVPDLPAEESEMLAKSCHEHDVDLIFMITPVTNDERISKILKKSSGFVYVVSRLGVTGKRSDISDTTADILSRVTTELPKAVGFGISNGEQAAKVVEAGADGVIVGSALVDIIASGNDVTNRIASLTADLKNGCSSFPQ